MLSVTFTLAQEILQVQCVDACQNSMHPSSKNLVSSDSWFNAVLIRYEACLASFSQKCIQGDFTVPDFHPSFFQAVFANASFA